MMQNLLIFALSLFLLIKGATLSTRYAGRLAQSFNLSKYIIGFIVVAIISILPETFIGINAALSGLPSFGLATLFGSNVADLTIVFAIIVAVANRGIKIESQILKNNLVYPFLLIMPLVLGLDGYYSRLEGLALIIAGAAFYYLSFKNGVAGKTSQTHLDHRFKNLIFLIFSLLILLIGAHFVVESATDLAYDLGLKPILIGMLIVSLGTAMPELFFSIKSVKKHNDSLAIGDVLGTVLADATVVVGILALISPFAFSQKIIYITGVFMVVAAFILFYFMRSGRVLSRKESYLLFAFWVIFVFVEFMFNK